MSYCHDCKRYFKGESCPACYDKSALGSEKEDGVCRWNNRATGGRCKERGSLTLDSSDPTKKIQHRRWFCSYHAYCYINGLPDSPGAFEAYQKAESFHKNPKHRPRPNDGLFRKENYTAEEIEGLKRGAAELLKDNPGLMNHPTFKTYYEKLTAEPTPGTQEDF